MINFFTVQKLYESSLKVFSFSHEVKIVMHFDMGAGPTMPDDAACLFSLSYIMEEPVHFLNINMHSLIPSAINQSSIFFKYMNDVLTKDYSSSCSSASHIVFIKKCHVSWTKFPRVVYSGGMFFHITCLYLYHLVH